MLVGEVFLEFLQGDTAGNLEGTLPVFSDPENAGLQISGLPPRGCEVQRNRSPISPKKAPIRPEKALFSRLDFLRDSLCPGMDMEGRRSTDPEEAVGDEWEIAGLKHIICC